MRKVQNKFVLLCRKNGIISKIILKEYNDEMYFILEGATCEV